MNIDLKPFKHWLVLGALLIITLSFPCTREAHSLCWRWLLHGDGQTTVQGLPDEYGYHFIPQVQFTAEHKRWLEARATNSIEEFYLASAGEFEYAAQPPPVETDWKSSPLLPAMVFHMVLRSASTNWHTLTPASMGSVRKMIQMARSSDPANGAFLQAEACFDFANNDPEAALRALWTSCSNRTWNAEVAASFTGYIELFERAGFSTLDATIEATRLEPLEGTFVAGRNRFYLDELMLRAIQAGKPEEFTRLFQLLVELRRADWLDKSPRVYNLYRRFEPSDGLAEAMAVALGMNPKTNWIGFHKDHNVDLQIQQVFQNYLNRNVDPIAMTVFTSQTESYQIEKRLRSQLYSTFKYNFLGQYLYGIGCQIAGGISMMLLTLWCFTLMYKVIRCQYRRSRGLWWRKPGFWLLALAAVLLGGDMFARFLHVVTSAGIDGDRPCDGIPLAVVCCLGLAAIGAVPLIQWVRGRVEINSWKVMQFFAGGYLVAILAMGFFRTLLVAYFTAVYQ